MQCWGIQTVAPGTNAAAVLTAPQAMLQQVLVVDSY